MKNASRILSLLLCLVMVLSCFSLMTFTAVADEETDPFEFTDVQKIVLGTHDGDPFPPHAAGQSFAVKTTVPADRRLASICAGDLATYSAPCHEIRYDVFQWNTDYDTTVAGEALWTYTEYDHADNSTVTIPLDNKTLINGDVLIVFTCIEAEAGITPWHSNMKPENTTFFDNGVECPCFTFVIETAKLPTKTVDKNVNLLEGGQGGPLGGYKVNESVAFKYDLPAGALLNRVTFCNLATYNDSADNSIKVDVFNWNTDYATTVAGEPIASKTETPHADNQDFTVEVGVEVAGPILAVCTYLQGTAGMTPWTAAGPAAAGAAFFANGAECAPFRATLSYVAEEPLTPPDPVDTQMDPTYVIDFGKFVEDAATEYGLQNPNGMDFTSKLDSGYITFTDLNGDPYVWIMGEKGLYDLPTKHVQYMVVKYRSFGGTSGEMFVQRADGVQPGQPGSHVAFNYIADANWHTVVVDASNEWGSADTKLTIFRLDPVANAAGSQIDISYVAFFSNKEAAEAYAAADTKVVHAEGELTEGNPAILPIFGINWGAQTWFELKENLVEVDPAPTTIDADFVAAMSPDTYIVNGENVKDGAAHDYIANDLGGKIDNSDFSKATVGFRGWAWPNDGGEVADYGYSLNDGEIVWGGEIILDEGIIPILNNEQVRRYIITIPTTAEELADGTYNVYLWVKSSNGDINRLGAWNDFQLIQGDGITRKSEGLCDDAGNAYTLKGQRVCDADGIDTGLIAWNCDDGRLVAASTVYTLSYQDPMSGAIEIGDKKYIYDEKIAVSPVYEIIDPEDNSVVSDNAGVAGCPMSPDTLFIDDVTVKDGAAHSYIANDLKGMIRDTDRTMGSFSLRGWAHTSCDTPLVEYGYCLNNGEIIWSADWLVAPEGGLAAAAGGANCTRFKIDIDVSGLEDGMYNVYAFVKDADGGIFRLATWGEFKFVKGGTKNVIGYTDGTNSYGVDSVLLEENGQLFVLTDALDVTDGIPGNIDYNTVVDSYELDMGTAVIVNENDPGWGEGYTWPAAGYTVAGNKMVNLWGANGQVIFESLPFADYNTVEIIVGSDPSCDAFRVGFVKDVAHLYGINMNGVDDLEADLISAVAPAGSEGQPNLSGRGEGAGWNSVERLVRLDISNIDYAAPVAISVGSVAPHTMVVAKVTFINYAQETVKGKYVYNIDLVTANTPKAPVDPAKCQPVFILDGEGLNTLSPKDIEDAVYDYEAGCIRYTSTNADPNAGSAQIPAGTVVAPWMVVKYRTECEDTRGEIFLGTSGGAIGDSNVPFPGNYEADGEWHYFVVNVGTSKNYDHETNVINHFRNDCLQQPDQWVEIEYYAFFDTQEKAEYYAANDLHELPQPPKTFVATFVADGEVVGTVEFKEGAKVLTGTPKVPAKEGYTGKWEKYTLADADITINAVYTPKDGEVTEPDTEPATEPATDAPTEPATAAPTEPATTPATEPGSEGESETTADGKGCKSVVAASGVIALVAVFGMAFVAKKKKED